MFRPLLSAVVDLSKIKYPVLVSPKFDGIRCLIQDGKAVTRSLKSIPNLYVKQQLAIISNLGLDGELIVGSPTNPNCMQVTSSGIMSHNGKPDFSYYVFDYANDLYIKDKIPFFIRLLAIREVCPILPSFVKFVEHGLIKNEDELLRYEEEMVSLGYEGVMVRDFNGIYKTGRSTVNEGILLKMKRFIDEEASIIGFEERLHNSNDQSLDERGYSKRNQRKDGMIPTDTLGAIIVYSSKWGEFNIGSGFDDIQRQEIWDNQDFYLGKQVTFKYQSHGVKDKPRMPIFKSFREDI